MFNLNKFFAGLAGEIFAKVFGFLVNKNFINNIELALIEALKDSFLYANEKLKDGISLDSLKAFFSAFLKNLPKELIEEFKEHVINTAGELALEDKQEITDYLNSKI